MKVILINNLNHWNFISYFWTKIHNVYSLCSSCISKAAAAEIGGDAAFYVAKSSISWDGNNHTKRRYFFPFFSFLIFSPWESWLHPYAWSNYPFLGHYPLWQLGLSSNQSSFFTDDLVAVIANGQKKLVRSFDNQKAPLSFLPLPTRTKSLTKKYTNLCFDDPSPMIGQMNFK